MLNKTIQKAPSCEQEWMKGEHSQSNNKPTEDFCLEMQNTEYLYFAHVQRDSTEFKLVCGLTNRIMFTCQIRYGMVRRTCEWSMKQTEVVTCKHNVFEKYKQGEMCNQCLILLEYSVQVERKQRCLFSLFLSGSDANEMPSFTFNSFIGMLTLTPSRKQISRRTKLSRIRLISLFVWIRRLRL